MKTSQLVAVVFFIFELIRILYFIVLQKIDDVYFLMGSFAALLFFPILIYFGIEILQRKIKSNTALGIYMLASFVLTPIIPIIFAIVLDRTIESPETIATNEDAKLQESQPVKQEIETSKDSKVHESIPFKQLIAKSKESKVQESKPVKQEIATNEDSKLKESKPVKQGSNKSLSWMSEAQREEFEALARKKKR